MDWQLQEAKNKFSKVVDEAIKKGPQLVTRRGKKVVVVMSVSDFEGMKKSKDDIVSFFKKSPLTDSDICSRNKSKEYREVSV